MQNTQKKSKADKKKQLNRQYTPDEPHYKDI